MKCKKEVSVSTPKLVTMPNGVKAVRGTCPKCGTKVFRFVGK
jgi:DNA-directed RNA polymerase subunit RPC12/RpoP